MPSLFTELRRRNVFKVGAAYAIVAWLLIEVSSVLLPTFNAPEWIMQVFTLFVILGFPLALILAWAFDLTPQGIKAASDVHSGSAPPQIAGQRLSYVFQGLVLLAVGFLVVDQYVLEPQADTSARASSVANVSSRPVRRYSMLLGTTESMGFNQLNAYVALSRDGRRIAYTVQVDGTPQLYLRELDQLTARAIPGTDGANEPFFSPDGEWVAFNIAQSAGAGVNLTKVSVRGGPTQILAGEVQMAVGGFWTTDDSIIFTANISDGLNRLHRIAAAGGTPELLDIDSDRSEFTHSWPHLLPSGDHLLFTIRPENGDARDGRVAVLTLETGESWTLIEGAYNARYTPTGHIVFMRSAALWAVPFDLERLEITGSDVPVVNGVQTAGNRGAAVYSFSDDGLLVYLPGIDTNATPLSSLFWVDREGREEVLDVEAQSYVGLSLSPDGQRIAAGIEQSGRYDIWVYDLVRGTRDRIVSDSSDDGPLWTPDGQRVIYGADREPSGIFWRAANGIGPEERLTSGSRQQFPWSVSADGTQLFFGSDEAGTFDIYSVSLEGEHVTELIIQTPATNDGFAALSPDGRWLAHISIETGGSPELYVRPFPTTAADRWHISPVGGSFFDLPIWGPGGDELFYYASQSGELMVVAVETGPNFSRSTPEALFAWNGQAPSGISPDGERFLARRQNEQTLTNQTSLVVVDNWFEELNRLAPPSP